jgi:hypothetical protein
MPTAIAFKTRIAARARIRELLVKGLSGQYPRARQRERRAHDVCRQQAFLDPKGLRLRIQIRISRTGRQTIQDCVHGRCGSNASVGHRRARGRHLRQPSSRAWRPALLFEKWPIQVAISEPQEEDEGFIHIEARIGHGVGSDALVAKKLGFAFQLQSAGPSGVSGVVPNLVRLPWTDGAPPLPDDVSTWESVFFGTNQTDDLRGIRIDGAPRG